MNKEIQRVLSLMVVGVGLSSPISGKSAEQTVDSNKALTGSVGVSDTDRGIETSETSGVLSEAEKKIIDMRFKGFLESEGKYSEEELKKRLFYSYNNKDRADLGFCGLNGNNILIQGIFLGHFNKDDRNFVAIGLKDFNKERKIVLAEWPIDQRMDAYSEVGVQEMIGGASSASYETIKMHTKEDVVSFLENKVEDVLVFKFYNLGDKKAFLKEYQGKVDENKINFFLDYVIPRWNNNIDFASGVLVPSTKEIKMMPEEVEFIKSLRNKDLTTVSKYCDISNLLDKNLDNYPVLYSVMYNKYLH